MRKKFDSFIIYQAFNNKRNPNRLKLEHNILLALLGQIPGSTGHDHKHTALAVPAESLGGTG